MKRTALALCLSFAAVPVTAQAQQIVEMTAGEVRIVDLPAMFDRLIMPPTTEVADVSPVGGRRVSIIGYKPGRFQVVTMNGESVTGSFWVSVKDAGLYERNTVTVYRNARPQEIHSCSQETGACVLYKDLRPPPPPIISTGPVITQEAVQAAQPRQ
jgi:hypothetical protein